MLSTPGKSLTLPILVRLANSEELTIACRWIISKHETPARATY